MTDETTTQANLFYDELQTLLLKYNATIAETSAESSDWTGISGYSLGFYIGYTFFSLEDMEEDRKTQTNQDEED